MENLIDLKGFPVNNVLDKLLDDKTTKQKIIFATDDYSYMGSSFTARSQMTIGAVIGIDQFDLQPRITKSLSDQHARTRKRAEVFTPSWLCNQMNNDLEQDWFGDRTVFNFEQPDHTWIVNNKKIPFSDDHPWQDYVKSRRLEITCGEAPFIVSRYDASTGKLIVPPINRIGLLDRKLRVVNENTDNEKEWLKWTFKALESVYGYEYQGDNLLIARINVLNTFEDYLEERLGRIASKFELEKAANIIAWNFWQMDGKTGTIPFSAKKENPELQKLDLFRDEQSIEENTEKTVGCRIYDWSSNRSQSYESLRGNMRV